MAPASGECRTPCLQRWLSNERSRRLIATIGVEPAVQAMSIDNVRCKPGMIAHQFLFAVHQLSHESSLGRDPCDTSNSTATVAAMPKRTPTIDEVSVAEVLLERIPQMRLPDGFKPTFVGWEFRAPTALPAVW